MDRAARCERTPTWSRALRALAPDFLFSFYYRRMLKPPLLALARRGALNMHGSLLPHYRGRAPVNWAVLHGERETGATLHYMAAKPDAGDIVAQQAVPILPDDTAREVFDKVTVAAEIALDARAARAPRRHARRACRTTSRAARISAAARRRTGASTGRRTRAAIHNLVRAVAPPYPGAFTDVAGASARVLRTRLLDADTPAGTAMLAIRTDDRSRHRARPRAERQTCSSRSARGGGTLRIEALEIDGQRHSAAMLRERFGNAALPLG